MRILIPMSGYGQRFKDKGYTFPKPLIDVRGKPMIEFVLGTLPKADEFIFIVRTEHEKQFGLTKMLDRITNYRATVITTDKVTEGAACSALLARDLLMDDTPLLIANSDQYVEYSLPNFELLASMAERDRDLLHPHAMAGMIFTFNATHPKWSFVETDHHWITRVAEKDPISNVATCGIYYWSKSSDFVKSADTMIQLNQRVNGEFYIAPTFNTLIKDGKWIAPFFVDKMCGLGTPEDLEAFLNG